MPPPFLQPSSRHFPPLPLIEHYGRAIAGLLRTNPEAARVAVGGALGDPAVVCRFPDAAVAANVTTLLCRDPPVSNVRLGNIKLKFRLNLIQQDRFATL